MGRGPHKNHIERKTQVNVKFTNTRLKLLVDNLIISSSCRIIGDDEPLYGSANEYVNKLVEADLIKRRLINND